MPRAHRRWDSSATLSRSARSPSEALRGAGRGRSRDRAEAIRHDIGRASDPTASKARRFIGGIGGKPCAISTLCPQARRTWPATSASPIRLNWTFRLRPSAASAASSSAAPPKDRGGELLHHEPVNLIADLTNPMWSSMVPDPRYRCLIPVAAFAQPDGKRGSMTRTWFRVNIRAVLSDIASLL